MSNPRIPANFNWDFKKNTKMSNEEHRNMLNQNPELNALIQIDNQDQDENVAQNNGGVAQNNDTLEEFNYNGKLGNNHELKDDEDGKDNPELGDKDNGDNNDSNHDLL